MLKNRTRKQLVQAVEALTGQTPQAAMNVFGRHRAEVDIPSAAGDGEHSFAGLGATYESALLDLLRDVAVHFRKEIEHAHGCTTADDEEDDNGQ